MNHILLVTSSFLFATIMSIQPSADLLKDKGDAQETISPEGTWRGKSICLDKNSGCHDEEVVYRITHDKGSNSYTVDADKIVEGKTINMGPLMFSFDQAKGMLTSEMGKNSWQIKINGNQMEGKLMKGNEAFRKIALVKDK
jgi:hypothetical protein